MFSDSIFQSKNTEGEISSEMEIEIRPSQEFNL